MISIVKKYLNELKIDLLQDNESYLVVIDVDHLPELFKRIRATEASLLAMLLIPSKVGFNIKYLFYPNIQDKILIIETFSENAELISLSEYFPILALYETDYAAKHNLNFKKFNSLQAPFDNPSEFKVTQDAATVIPVGPIHAGVIEPGHFRFTAFGEHVAKLEIKLGYLHRGVEEALIGANIEEGLELAENICGDSTVAYGLAYSQAAEKILKIKPSYASLLIRSLILELERLYNHVADIAALVNDTGFSFGYSRLICLKEQLLRLNQEIFEHRFIRGYLALGGVRFIPESKSLRHLEQELKRIQENFSKMVYLVRANNGVLERFKNTGVLNLDTAQNLSVSGLVGRASGISFDLRRDLSFAAYASLNFNTQIRKTGDVLARYNLRISEVYESFHLAHQCLDQLISMQNHHNEEDNQVLVYDENYAFAFVEATRGPILVYMELDEAKRISYAKFRDVSFHNWKALEHAVLKNIVADFPICNKSFSLSYSGNDL